MARLRPVEIQHQLARKLVFVVAQEPPGAWRGEAPGSRFISVAYGDREGPASPSRPGLRRDIRAQSCTCAGPIVNHDRVPPIVAHFGGESPREYVSGAAGCEWHNHSNRPVWEALSRCIPQ